MLSVPRGPYIIDEDQSQINLKTEHIEGCFQVGIDIWRHLDVYGNQDLSFYS